MVLRSSEKSKIQAAEIFDYPTSMKKTTRHYFQSLHDRFVYLDL